MMVESRPLHLLLCVIGAPLRLRPRYHADPLLTGAAIVVYTHMPIANYTVASSFAHQDQPTHHTDMMVESRPLHLLLCVIGAPLRLRPLYHAYPLPTGAAIVVYICMPIANYAVESYLIHQGLPTHHTIWWWRVDLYTSCFAYSGRLFDYSNGTTPIHCQQAHQSSSTYVCQSKITQ